MMTTRSVRSQVETASFPVVAASSAIAFITTTLRNFHSATVASREPRAAQITHASIVAYWHPTALQDQIIGPIKDKSYTSVLYTNHKVRTKRSGFVTTLSSLAHEFGASQRK